MNVVICEDDLHFSNLLRDRLAAMLSAKELPCDVKQFSTGEACLKHLRSSQRTDLLFMDIQLGAEDGVGLVKTIRETLPKLPVIFLTSMEDRIGEGYDVSAFYFLLKKDFEARLEPVFDRFIKEVFMPKSLVLKNGNDLTILDYDDIYYVEADKRSSLVHCANATYSENSSIQNFAPHLPSDLFLEVYHALYVNVDHVRRVDADSLELDNDQSLPVSRRKRKDLMSAIMWRIQNR